MNSRYYRTQVEQAISGADGLANNLPLSSLRSFRFALPVSVAEQKAIVREVLEATAVLRAAARRTEGEIDLLREYRTRLIADVATGKLDVREAAARLPDETEDTDSLDDFETESVDEEAAADSPEEALEDSEA